KYDYRYRFGAQLSYDFVAVDEVPEQYNDKDWRRVRAFHKGSFFNEKLFYEIEYSFLGEGAYKDLFIGYENRFKAINTDYRIKVGNIKIPFSLETYTSSKYTMFMERALTDAFSMGRKVGAELLLSTKLGDARVNTFLSAFSNSVEERKDDEVDLPGYSTRLTYGYKFGKYHLFSLGGAYLTQDIKQENIKYKQAVESDFMRDEFVSTRVKDIDSVKKRNFELLYINHKFSLQAEYVQVSLDALKDSYSFDAYYIQGSYFLLGVGRKYKFSNSTMANVKPYAQGALELAFRYSYINLNDKDEQGGTQLDYNYGLNWYISKELKATLNYVVAQPKTESYDGLLQVLQARVLFAF
ncbi:MAG: porin, partial [Campylobacterota bacterium]|nr:porin [Campylobacterota bacterium]